MAFQKQGIYLFTSVKKWSKKELQVNKKKTEEPLDEDKLFSYCLPLK